MTDLQRDIDIIDGLFAPHPTKIQNPATVAAWQRLRARLEAQTNLVEACEGLLHCMALAGWSDDYWAKRGRAAIAAIKDAP